MSDAAVHNIGEPWSRPPLDRTQPIRSAGGLYRTSDDGQTGIGGVPLNAAEDAVVAAVRMAYKVAAAQIDRSTRLARRLRDAGDRAAGPHSDRKAIDATEQLIFKAVMSALTWLERSAGEPDPIKRMMIAQYRLAGSILGLTAWPGSVPPGETAGHRPIASASAADLSMREAVQIVLSGLGLSPAEAAQTSAPDSPAGTSSVAASVAPEPPLRIILKGQSKRHVRAVVYKVARGNPLPNVRFYRTADVKAAPLSAGLAIDAHGQATLTIQTTRLTKPGLWKAAVCADGGLQLGVIEIEL